MKENINLEKDLFSGVEWGVVRISLLGGMENIYLLKIATCWISQPKNCQTQFNLILVLGTR